MTLVEVAQRAYNSLCIRDMWLFIYIYEIYVTLLGYSHLCLLNKFCLGESERDVDSPWQKLKQCEAK